MNFLVLARVGENRIHYAWFVVAATFVTLITTAGFRATPGVLLVPLQDEFGWSRATIGLAVSLGLLMYGLGAPFSAALMERFGVRRVMAVPLAATVATRWFEERRGLVTGVLTASNASGQLVFLPSLAWLASTYGWRAASLAVSSVAIGIVFPIVELVVRDR